MLPDDIAPTTLRDFAKSMGWEVVREFDAPGQILMDNQNLGRQLLFPISDQVPDYADAIENTLQRIASATSVAFKVVYDDILVFGDDGLDIRLAEGRIQSEEIPLEFAKDCLDAARSLVLSAATSVVSPRLIHRKLGRNPQAKAVLDSTNFRHTQRGSFSLRLSCSLTPDSLPSSLGLDAEGAPIVRRTFRAIIEGTRSIVRAIEQDREAELIEEVKDNPKPIISVNLCEALAKLHSNRLENSVILGPRFSRSLDDPHLGQLREPIRIQRDYFQRIGQLVSELRRSDEPREQVYVGTVERLDGDFDREGKRSGSVTLLLQSDEEEGIRANVLLEAAEYEEAVRVHQSPRTFVKISGTMNPGNQPRTFRSVTHFSVIE